jgi:RNA polymerase sigma-70 factor (ECF subfamily)
VRLAPIFRRQIGPGSPELDAAPGRGEDDDALEGALAALLARGRAAWPGVEVAPEAFAADLGRRLAEPPDASTAETAETAAPGAGALGALHAEDLYLACACAAGDARAVALFERRFLAPVAEALARRRTWRGPAEDFKQILGARLVVRGAESLPRIAAYAGRGPLAAWVRVAAVRTALNLQASSSERDGGPLPDDGADALALTATAPDPDLALLRVQCRDEFREAFAAALDALGARERTVLRFHFLQGVEGEALARMYGVSRRTVHRWIEQGRRSLLEGTRELLAARLEVSPHELKSLMQALQSELGSTLLGRIGKSDP